MFVKTDFQLLMLSSNLLKSKIPMSGEEGGGGFMETNFQLLMLSSNLLKFKIPMSGGGGGHGNQFQTFDAEFKFSKIQNSYVQWGGGGFVETSFQLLMLSSNFLKSKIPMSGGGGGGEGWWNQLSTFDAEFKFAKQKKKFSGKSGNGFVLDFAYQVVCL